MSGGAVGQEAPDRAVTDGVSLPWYESLRPRLRDGHEVELLESGAQFFPALIAAIDAASREIHLETYMFVDDRSGRRVAQALVDACQRGVKVHCVVDGFGTPRLEGEVARLMTSASIRVEIFRPERRRFALNRQRLRRMHRKITIIDGETVFVGGINLVDDWFDPNHGELDAPRYDYAVRVRGPLVVAAQIAASRLWWEVSLVNRSLRKLRPRGAAGTEPERDRERFVLPDWVQSYAGEPGTLKAMLVVRDNFRYRRIIERWYLRAIGKARREVLIANAYFLPGTRFRRALIKAVRRGVRVRLLLQGRVEYRMQHLATQALYESLLREGIEIYEYRSSFLHAKVAVIDDHATVGSSNIDPFSLLMAREANIVVADGEFATRLRQSVEKAIEQGSERQELDRHQRRPWPQRVLNWFAFALLRLAVSLSGQGSRY